MSIIKWNNQSRWESYEIANNIDTKEKPDYLRRLLLTDSFNNSELSSQRWTINSKNNIKYEENTNNLSITSIGSSPSFNIEQNNYLPDVFNLSFEFSNLSNNTSIYLNLESSAKTTSIIITNTSITIKIDSISVYSGSKSLSSGNIKIDYYDNYMQIITIYDENNNYHYMYNSTEDYTTNPKVKLITTSTNTSGLLCNYDSITVNGFSDGTGHMLGYAKYKFNTSGSVTGLYYDATIDPEETHYIQISPDGTNWYGPGGIDTSFTGSYSPITTVPKTTTGSYYWDIWMVPSQFDDSDITNTLSTYSKLERNLIATDTFSSYVKQKNALINTSTYTSFTVIADSLINTNTYSSFSETDIAIAITMTDYFWSISNVRLGNGDELTGYYLNTSTYDGIGILGSYTGTLLVQDSTGTYTMSSNSLKILNTTSSNYVKIIAVGTVNINYLGVFGIWL